MPEEAPTYAHRLLMRCGFESEQAEEIEGVLDFATPGGLGADDILWQIQRKLQPEWDYRTLSEALQDDAPGQLPLWEEYRERYK